jgi:hypothetical protein
MSRLATEIKVELLDLLIILVFAIWMTLVLVGFLLMVTS